MVHDVHTIREDLAYMRALAQEGRRAPLLIGFGLIASGVVFGSAALISWAVEVHLIAAPQWVRGAIWPLAIVIFMPAVRWWRAERACEKPGATALSNRATTAAMRGLGYAMLSLMFAGWALAYSLHSYLVFALFPSVVLAIYGAAWMVAAAMSELAWLRSVAAGAFVACVVAGFTASHSYGMLVFAALFALVTIAPGVALSRGEPSRVV